MAINFPNSPSVNDIHVSGANRWQWNGSSWTRIGGVNSDSDTINSSNDNSTTTLYPVMVTGTGDQTAKISTTATKNISFDASDGNLTVGGNISVGGTITYEDVTNVDSVGVVTARAGVKITGGDLTVGTAATISSVGNITAGIVTAASGQLISGVGIDTSGTVVGYAATIIHFRGPGVSTAYYSSTTGVGTVYFQGGGGSASVSISESAPSSPSAGDMWWDSDVGNLQIYYTDANSSQWVTANNAGPQGPQGAQGAAGAQGAQGYQGVQGSVGIASLTISTGAPSSPAAGDMWWDSDDGDLHLYFNDGNSSQWVNINAGSAGAQGVQGAAGSNGAAGAQGAQGAAGASGAVTDAQRNTKAGTNAGDSFSGTDATDNTLIGYDSGTAITTGDKNTLVGSYAGDSVTTSANITAIGYYAASTVSTQSVWTGITAVGSNACKTSVGVRNSVVGFDALKTGSSAAYNCIFGNEAARQSDGSNNIVIGDSALLYGTSTASYNIALGRNAFVGSNSNHASSHSISIGYDSMYNANRTTSWGNIAIGSSAGKVLTTGFNNIIIGDSAEASAATENNEITLGNSNHVKFRVPGIKFEAEDDEYHFSCDHNLASYVQRFDGVWGNWSPNFNFKATGASPSGTTLGQWGNHQNGHALTFVKSRNNGNSGTSCQAGDDLGSIFWSPYNSANPGCAAAVKVMADSGTWSSTSNPGYIQIMTAANGDKNPTERIRISSTGFVGIGTDNPVRKLHVEDDNAEIALYQSRRAAGSYVNYKVGANGAELGMIGSGAAILSGGADAGDFGIRAAGDLCVSSGGHAEKLRLTSAGKVLVGGTSAVGNGTNLEVLHSSLSSAARVLAHGFIARDNYGSPTNIGNAMYSPASNTLAFATDSTERLRIDADGVKFNGDTATANGLDDYEEGSWTPTYDTSGSTGSITVGGYATQVGRYVKIGRLVYIEGVLKTSSISVSTSGTYDIGGLPFTSNTAASLGGVRCYLQNAWTNAPDSFDNVANTTRMRARQGRDVGASSYTTGNTNDFNTNAGDKNRIYFSGHYRI